MNEHPYLTHEEAGVRITEAGYAYLDRIVTDSRGPVYAFRPQASPVMVAASMARLSRCSNDLRVIYLDEFAAAGEHEAAALIKRVVTDYGDDSVQQLVGTHFVVEGASNLLTKQLEWGRLGAYLEQSTRYIFFDEKGPDGRFRYFVPEHIRGSTRDAYVHTMDALFEQYSAIVRGTTRYVRGRTESASGDPRERTAWLGATRAQACDAARPTLPVATTSTVGLFLSAQAVETLVINLLSQTLPEARRVGAQILQEVRAVIPAFLDRADLPDRGGATSAYRAANRAALRLLAAQYVRPKKGPDQTESVQLLDYWPADELSLVPEMLCEATDVPLEEIAEQARAWPEERLRKVFEAYIGERLNRRQKPGRALEKAHYEWQITADYGTFRDLQRHRMVDAWEWQRLTPSYGYAVPLLVAEAGFEKQFRDNFARAAALHERLVRDGYAEEAQYATLLGHRMRYRFILNARAAFHLLELRTSPQGHPGYRRICQEMHRLLQCVHPRIGRAMRFINRGEDPELTRLAAERATQFKLAQLEATST